MKIEFDEPLYRGVREDPHDVRLVKRALGCLGFYVPDPHTGMTGEADPGFWSGLRAFQRVHTIPFDDVAGPGSVTERVMNEKLAALDRGDARYVWRTVGDDKVRGDHAMRAGRVFHWREELDGGHPGEDYNCRCWAEPLNPSRHPLAVEARAAQLERMTPALGLNIPDIVLIQPGVDAINSSIGPVEILAGNAIARASGGLGLSVINKILMEKKPKNSKVKEPTQHAAQRAQQRNISQSEIDKAIESSTKRNTYKEKIGKYGTKQIHYEGGNGVNVIVELEGRNSGKIITVYRSGK